MSQASSFHLSSYLKKNERHSSLSYDCNEIDAVNELVTGGVDLVDEIFDVEDKGRLAVAAAGTTGRLAINDAECSLDDVTQQD